MEGPKDMHILRAPRLWEKGSQMERVQELAIIRRAYAKQILAAAQIDDPSLELAFAQVRREDFLGPGPWVIPYGQK